MRAVVQRVKKATVSINGEIVGSIQHGLLVFLGIGKNDSNADVDYFAEKIPNLRIFQDEGGKFNRSLLDIGGQILVVSQFTLYGDCRKGRRPSFTDSAEPRYAEELYLKFIEKLKESGIVVETGQFQAMMDVSLVNDGPVTMLLDSTKLF